MTSAKLLSVAAALGLFFGLAPAQHSQTAPQTASKIGVLPIQGNVYLLYGAGANITMLAQASHGSLESLRLKAPLITWVTGLEPEGQSSRR